MSRAGQIYVSGSVLGWLPPLTKELNTAVNAQVDPEEPKPVSKAEAAIILQLYEQAMEFSLSFTRRV